MTYEFMEPKKKRRHYFTTEEYRNAGSIEMVFWMAIQETKFISMIIIVLSWWFIASPCEGVGACSWVPRIMGPFADYQQCEKLKSELLKQPGRGLLVTECWNDMR